MSRHVPAYQYASPFDRKNDGEQIPVLTYSIQTNVFRRRHDSTLGKVPTCVARRPSQGSYALLSQNFSEQRKLRIRNGFSHLGHEIIVENFV